MSYFSQKSKKIRKLKCLNFYYNQMFKAGDPNGSLEGSCADLVLEDQHEPLPTQVKA